MQSKDYSPSQLAVRLHTLPHLDMTFQKVNATFNPDLYRYREVSNWWFGDAGNFSLSMIDIFICDC